VVCVSDLEEVAARVDAVLRMHGYQVGRIEYPEDYSRRSIDIVAVGPGDHTLLLKVARDVGDVSLTEMRELQACSRVLRGRGLIVAETDEGVDIDAIAAHEKMGLYAVSAEGLEAALRDSIYVVKRQGNYYMNVDGSKLRERRLEKGYSLGDVAALISTSRRSVYMYEQEESMVSLRVALRLMEVFDNDIFKPIDILSPMEGEQRQRRRPRSRLAAALYEAGYEVAETRHVPPNAMAAGETGRVLVVVERRRETDLERRVEESEKVARRIKALVISVGGSVMRRLAERYDVYSVSSYDEIALLLRQLSEQERGGREEPSSG